MFAGASQLSGRRASVAAPGQRARPRARNATTRVAKLYTNPGSRGKMPEWYIAESGAPVELVTVDMKAGQHKAPEYLAMHPFGQVPVLDDDGTTIFESGAILLYLAAKFEKLDPAALGKAAQWTLCANTTVSDAFFGGAQRKRDSVLDTLDGILAKQPYLEGEKFTVGDIAVGGYLLYLPLFFPDMFPLKQQNVWAYMQRLAAREACPVAYKEGVAAAAARGGGGGGGGLGGLFSKIGGR